jgi:hypothetical protein
MWVAEPLRGILYWVVGPYWDSRAQSKVPEFDHLNDELLARIPTYPNATRIPGVEERWGPYIGPLSSSSPAQPRTLEVCFSVDASFEQVGAFYENILIKEGWELTYSSYRSVLGWSFVKGKACIWIGQCTIDGKAYTLRVYHDLNTLVGFPPVPDKTCPYW